MVQKQLFLTILSGVIVAGLLSILSVTQGMVFTPQFEIQVKSISDDTEITLKNIGLTQAKNAIAFINNTKNAQLLSEICYEGKINENQRVQYVINFEKMSTNVDCKLIFEGQNQHYFHILMVADDTPGKSWSFQDQLDNSSFVIFTVFPIILSVTIAITLGNIGSMIYSTIMRKRRQESFKIRELELEKEIKDIQNEKNILRNKQGTGRTPDEIERDNKRIDVLDEQISEITSELDELRTKMLSDKKTEKNIGKFYTKWTLLEQELTKLADKHNLGSTVMARYNSGIIMRKLFETEIIDSELYANYQSIRRFRNSIAHGLTTPINKDLEANLVTLDSVYSKIKSI